MKKIIVMLVFACFASAMIAQSAPQQNTPPPSNAKVDRDKDHHKRHHHHHDHDHDHGGDKH